MSSEWNILKTACNDKENSFTSLVLWFT